MRGDVDSYLESFVRDEHILCTGDPKEKITDHIPTGLIILILEFSVSTFRVTGDTKRFIMKLSAAL